VKRFWWVWLLWWVGLFWLEVAYKSTSNQSSPTHQNRNEAAASRRLAIDFRVFPLISDVVPCNSGYQLHSALMHLYFPGASCSVRWRRLDE